MRLVRTQALRLGIILLVCGGITVVTSTFVQTPVGNAALTALVRRGGPERFEGAPNQAPGPQRVRGVAPQGGGEGGGRLLPNIRAGLPEVVRSAATMAALALGVVIRLKVRKLTRRAVPVRVSPRRRV